MKGFFSSSPFKSAPPASLPSCGACKLHKGCISPRMPVTGQGGRSVLVVAEAPGEREDQKNEQLIGKSGQLLRRILRSINCDLDRDCWKTNAIICRPPNNKTPTDKQLEYCYSNLVKTINELKPRVILLLGFIPTKQLLRNVWKSNVGSIGKWVGFTIPCQSLNAWICPTYHPSYLLRANQNVLNKIFAQHLTKAMGFKQHPFQKVPDYKSKIEIIVDPSEAAAIMHQMRGREGPSAFDYETNMLKPEGAGAQIVSCSICWGNRTIAYPWYGEAIKATKRYLRSPVPKIASNMKFEERWSKTILKTPVRNWLWDTMIAAHAIDSRSGITSVKFQSFVLLGMGEYDAHIHPYLQAPSSMMKNRIKEIDIEELLLYNGIDSLLEHKVALKQMKVLK